MKREKSRLKYENRLVKKVEAALSGARRLEYNHVARGRRIQRQIQNKHLPSTGDPVRDIQEDEDRRIMDLLEEAEGKL